jgi:hypothetical protein
MTASSLHQQTGLKALLDQLLLKPAGRSISFEPLEIHGVTVDPLYNEFVKL